MIVAVVTVWMMQMPIDQIVNVIAMGNGRMPAARTMHMPLIVTLALVGGTGVGIYFRHLNTVFIVMVIMGAVQMSIVKVAYVVSVLDGDMAAVWPVCVIVVFMLFTAHGSLCSRSRIDVVRIRMFEHVTDQGFYV